MKHYYSLNEYLQNEYGFKVYKLSLDGGMTCPNRDGTIGKGGCIFCSKGGSGEFSEKTCNSVTEQIERAKKRVERKCKSGKYIAYFQAFSNTYGPFSYLKQIFYEAIQHKDILILSVATRPDCLGKEVLDLLEELNHIKPIWVELGLQTIHQNSISYIRRGYENKVYEMAIKELHNRGIKVITHMIVGLPNESDDMILQTAKYIAKNHSDGIKIQLLQVLKDTDLYIDYQKDSFQTLSKDHYIELLGKIIEVLPKWMVIHRLTGDPPKNILVAPTYCSNKKDMLNSISNYFECNHIEQGLHYEEKL